MKIGDHVFIKDERNKTKARDHYVIVSIDGGSATLQKLTDKFMSRKYIIPLTRLYPASVPPIRLSPTNSEEEDSDEDYTFSCPPTSDAVVQGNDDDDIHNDDNGDIEVVPEADVAQEPVVTVRPRRVRQQPEWMRRGEYDLDSEDHGA